MATETRSSDGPDTAELSRQIETLKKDMGALTQTLGEIARDRRDELSSEARQRLDKAMHDAEAQARAAGARAARLGEDAHDMVARQPGTALAIAAGLGFLVGFLGARR
ncbi:MAG: YqjD family protein [Paracoccaceae bacterium]